ncbi:hypothetical protein V6N13_038692 [Hibiscus sabdariffa]
MPHQEVQVQVTHSIPSQKIEMFKSLDKWVEDNILIHLKPTEKSWQPQDFLPDSKSDGFYDQVKELEERAKEIPDDHFIALVGDMITEEALPTYQAMLNIVDGIRDETGVSHTSWTIWIRAWTVEENRHDDLIVQLSEIVIEFTLLFLSENVQDVKLENKPFRIFIYTSFQERATFISHNNTAKLVREHGDTELAKLCGFIAADEKRHETAYSKIIEKLFEIDPGETVQAFVDMMRKKITMPAYLMYDGRDGNLFNHFSIVAQRLRIYTTKDYINILEFLVGRWKVKDLTGLSTDGRKAQEFVCELPSRLRKLEEKAQLAAKRAPTIPFSWIPDRELKL